MVLRFHGFPRQQDDIAFAAYNKRDGGTSLATIARYINQIAGVRAWLRERTSFETLKRCIDEDVPVMVPLEGPGQKEGHLTVAIGYDDGRQFMILAEPATGSAIRVPYRDFLRLWTGASLTVTPTRL
jgi:ABC-type bacteriocin/lantibiotic exporter with double-glycine peptidase domain